MLALRTRTRFLLFLVCLLVALADFLFYRHSLGWNSALFGSVLVCAATIRKPHACKALTLFLLSGLIAAATLQPGPLILLIGSLLLICFCTGAKISSDLLNTTKQSCRFLIKFPAFLVLDFWKLQRWKSRGQAEQASSWPAKIIRWVIPLVLTSVFFGLFLAANPLFVRESKILLNTATQMEFARSVFWLFSGSVLWALLRFKAKRSSSALDRPFRLGAVSAPIIVLRSLILFNLLFAIQTTLDLIYLWGGATLPPGLSYADYVHRGAYPLVATALLAAVFVLVTFGEGLPARETKHVRSLVYVWLAQNVFLTISALWRLKIYVAAYGLTRWRIAAMLWMMLVAAGLVWICARIVFGFTNRWLINRNLATAFLLLYLCCFLNFNGIIAWYNVGHCREVSGQGVLLDLQYIESLGPESIQPLQSYIAIFPTGTRIAEAEQRLLRLRIELNQDLQDWRGWTYRKHRIAKASVFP